MKKPKRKCDECPTVFEYRSQGPAPRRCPSCKKEAQRRYKREYDRRKRLERWGLTPQEEERLVARGCAICGGHDPLGHNWSMDHRHDCEECGGKKGCPQCFRDVLCGKCNKGLGQLHDDPERMKRAIEYLLNPPLRTVEGLPNAPN